MCSFARFRCALIAIDFSVCEGTGYLKPYERQIGPSVKVAREPAAPDITAAAYSSGPVGGIVGELSAGGRAACSLSRVATELIDSAAGVRFQDAPGVLERPNV